MVFFEDFGTDDVTGHQVGGELDAPKIKLQRFAEGAHQQGLAKSRHAFEQAMTASKKTDQQLLDHVRLADHGNRDCAAQFGKSGQVLLDGGFGEWFGHDAGLVVLERSATADAPSDGGDGLRGQRIHDDVDQEP